MSYETYTKVGEIKLIGDQWVLLRHWPMRTPQIIKKIAVSAKDAKEQLMKIAADKKMEILERG